MRLLAPPLFAVVLACAACGPAEISGEDPDGRVDVEHTTVHDPAAVQRAARQDSDDPAERLRSSCAAELDALRVDVELGEIPDADEFSVTVAGQSKDMGACGDFGWVRGFTSRVVTVEPSWDGPPITHSAWDCNHSSLEYGVYSSAGGRWQYVQGGLLFGNLTAQGCRYSVSNFPPQPGVDRSVVMPDGEHVEIRVGVRAWAHNDTRLGHPGDLCDSVNCFWPARLTWRSD